MASKRKVGNLLALAVLSYLSQQPMHPYELSRTLREHGDARSIKFNHGSLYMVVGQLAKAGYITEVETSRAGQRPERTVYALTDAGRAEFRDWLRELVAEPEHEYPRFVAAPRSAASLIARSPGGCPSCSWSKRNTGCRCWAPKSRSSRNSSGRSPTRKRAGAPPGPNSTAKARRRRKPDRPGRQAGQLSRSATAAMPGSMARSPTWPNPSTS